MHGRSGARTLIFGLILGLLLGLVVIVVANRPHRTTTLAETIVVHQPVYEFFAGKTGVQCAIDTKVQMQWPVPFSGITCFTNEPPRRVSLTDVGRIEQCRGTGCLANPGISTPQLATNTTVISGNQQCRVLADGVDCANSTRVSFTMTGDGKVRLGRTKPLLSITQPVFEFFGTPASGVECEMTYTSMLCLTVNPPHRVILQRRGSAVECLGVACLSDPGVGTPTLLAGTRVTNGIFNCDIREAAVRCHSRAGHGFAISKTQYDYS